MLDPSIVAGLAAVFLGVQAWAHQRSLLSEREAGEQRLQAQAEAHAEQIRTQAEVYHATLKLMTATSEATMDRLQARSALEYQAVRQVATNPQPEPVAEVFDADWEQPSFARPGSGSEVEE